MGRHCDSRLRSPFKSRDAPPKEIGSRLFPDVNWPAVNWPAADWPAVEGETSGSPVRPTGPRSPVVRDEPDSESGLLFRLAPVASPISNSVSLLNLELLPLYPPGFDASSFSLSASRCSNCALRTSSSSALFFCARNSLSSRSLSSWYCLIACPPGICWQPESTTELSNSNQEAKRHVRAANWMKSEVTELEIVCRLAIARWMNCSH